MTIVKILGIVVSTIGGALLLWQWRAIAGHEITTATVTSLLPRRGSSKTTYKVLATFKDTSGLHYEYVSAWASSPPAHHVGDEFRIMYDPNDPKKNYSLSFGTRFGFAWILLGIGFLILWIYWGWGYGDSYIQSSFPVTQ